MIEKEIRKDVRNSKGEIQEKLIFKTYAGKESIKIAIKQKSYIEPVLVDLEEILELYLPPSIINAIKKIISFYYKSVKVNAS